LVAFDGPNVFRYKLYSQYKANRKKKELDEPDLIHNKDGLVADSSPYEHLEAIRVYLADCGIPCVQKSQYEADDILCSVATQNKNVVCGNKDKDAFQYVLRPDISLYDSSFKEKGQPKPRTTLMGDVEAIFGVKPDLALDLQTLVGDSIDNIPTILSKAKAIKGLKQWGSIRSWLDNDKDFRALMVANKPTLMLNRKLVRLKDDIRVEIPAIRWNRHPDMVTSYIQFRDFCNPKSKGLF
jgi:DNA polymerase-1